MLKMWIFFIKRFLVSKSSARKGMSVRFRPPAPHEIKGLSIVLGTPFFVDLGDRAQNCAYQIFEEFCLPVRSLFHDGVSVKFRPVFGMHRKQSS